MSSLQASCPQARLQERQRAFSIHGLAFYFTITLCSSETSDISLARTKSRGPPPPKAAREPGRVRFYFSHPLP